MDVSLSGTWKWKPDPKGLGFKEDWFSAGGSDWKETSVPGCWNCDPCYEHYEGTFWYKKEFEISEDHLSKPDTEIFVEFNAVNYFCRAWVNGYEIGTHEGGYLPFEFEIRKDVLLPGGNRLVVMTENFRAPDRVPGELCDWFNYGGIVRDVILSIRNIRRFDSVKIITRLAGESSTSIKISWRQKEPFAFSWRIKDGGNIISEGKSGTGEQTGEINVAVNGVVFWSPDTPHLYTLELSPEGTAAADGFETRFGIREIKVDGTRILLNGKQIKMKGVSLHEELFPHGRSIPREERYRDVRDIKALGFNALRTAHYTHDEALVDAADEIGLLILEEIPVYWDLDYSSPKLFETASAMVRDMIARDFNHPSVVLWSVGNEVPVDHPDCDRFIRRLMDQARELDPTRIVTYVSCRFLIDKTRRASDVCCVNCYIGWYYGSDKDLKGMLDMVRETAPGQPWMMTEFGAGAKHGFHSRSRSKFSEERQAEFLSHYIRTLNSLDWISGWFIWIYRDFRSPLRTNRYQKGFNRKGIVSETNKKKLICSRFPKLLGEKYNIVPEKPPRLKMFLYEKLEELAYKTIQPALARSQKKKYDNMGNILGSGLKY